MTSDTFTNHHPAHYSEPRICMRGFFFLTQMLLRKVEHPPRHQYNPPMIRLAER